MLCRRTLALALVLAGCAPSLPPPRAAAARGPYEVPGIEAGAPALAGAATVGELGPIPVTPADPTRGDPLAPVTIVEFADFQCPFCRRAFETISILQKEYGADKIRFVWKNYPLPFHHDARPAAEVGMALLERGGSDGFWRYHDAIFSAQQELGRELFNESIRTAGFAPEDVTRAIRTGDAARRVDADERLGRQLGVTGTPTLFVNGVLIHGAQPIEKLRVVVDAQLAAARVFAAAGTPRDRLYAQLTAQSFVPPAQPEADSDPVDTTVYLVPVGASPARGPATAPVTIVEFADFQCPYCVRAEDTLKQVATRYGDKVRVVWKDAPLPFHKRAEPAAELAAEAFAQKGHAGFWRVHDLLLAQRGSLDDSDLAAVAGAAGLDLDAARRSFEKHGHREAIEDDLDLADDLDATGTPTFFVNGRKVVGAQPFEVFQVLIDEQLTAAQTALDRGAAPQHLYEVVQRGARSAPLETASVPAPTAASPSRGPQSATVIVQIWSDFECPFCKRVEPTLATLEAAFPGRIRVVWHNRPLPFHPHAMPAAEAAMEAFAQKGAPGFWRMHDLLLENQAGGLERAALEQYAATVGLDLARFRAALDGGVHRGAIEADLKIGEAAGLAATPGFAINGYRVTGAQPLARFKKVVRRALAEAK